MTCRFNGRNYPNLICIHHFDCNILCRLCIIFVVKMYDLSYGTSATRFKPLLFDFHVADVR